MQIVSSKEKYNSFTATKAIEQISQQIVSLAIEQVRVKLQTKQVPVFIFLLIALKVLYSKFCTKKLKDSIHFNFPNFSV
jgi:hypothetical protein